jgi:FkbM family methyltransferase
MTALSSVIRRKIRKHPRLYRSLLPWWIRGVNLHWSLRKSLRIPISFPAGAWTVKLYPEGQIPEMLWKGNFEAIERDFVSAYLKSGMRVVNVGANVGLYTVMAAALVEGGGEVHVFEPSRESYLRLMNNVELNGCRNVRAMRVALSNVRGHLLLRADPKNASLDGHRFVVTVGGGVSQLATDELVEARTLDDYMADQTRGSIDLIIMDVEGAELSVLQGAVNTLELTHPTILLECSKYHEETESLLRDLGYSFWQWDVNIKALVPVDFLKAAQVGDVVARVEGWSFES